MEFVFREAVINDIRQIQVVRNAVKENRLSNPDLVPDKDVEDYMFRRCKGWVCEINHSVIAFAIVSITDSNGHCLFSPGMMERGSVKDCMMT